MLMHEKTCVIPKLDLLLYGKRLISDEGNKHIVFISVQEYLIKTKRFK